MLIKSHLKAIVPATIQGQLVDELEAWVFSGLLAFWRRALPVDGGIYTLLHTRVLQVTGVDEQDWDRANQRWQAASQLPATKTGDGKTPFPLLQLAADYNLTPAQLFNLALTGLVETSHILNLALADLQAPDAAPRPCVHLVCALLNTLFGDSASANGSAPGNSTTNFNALDIAEQSLVTAHIIQLQGDGPLPLQRVQINPQLWSILLGRPAYWPQCELANSRAEQGWLLPPSAQAEIGSLAALLGGQQANQAYAGVVIRGNPNTGRGLFSEQLAKAMGLIAVRVPLTIWRDQPVFALACRYARWLPVVHPALAPSEALRFTPGPVPVAIILGSDGAVEGDMLEVILHAPNQRERNLLWQQALGDENNGLSEQLSTSALLSSRSIQLVARHAQQLAQRQQQSLGLAHIAAARLTLGADKLRLLAQPIARAVSADALVLPTLVKASLDAVVLRACKREALWDDLGDTLKVTPNPGVRALFVGESGTGKTLAASYIATRLGAPLYRVDLSSVMNKYIGESEKNLAQLLDQAAASDVVLLFDEADALFGSRSDGQENGERFANMLTNFLLTRIETHPGIVILTTNSRERIDNAFTRRLDTIVEFPLPGFEERLHLWRSHLGDRGPGEDLYRNLASICDIAGGQLRNVVVTAAVYAKGRTITHGNLLEGLRAEYRKQGRELPKKLEALSQFDDA